MAHEQDDYAIQRMDIICIRMLDSVTDESQRREAVEQVIVQLEAMKASGEEWAKSPHIPFRMGCMDERDLDERIADNIEALKKIERRITCLKAWMS